jgi:hypothetical protein
LPVDYYHLVLTLSQPLSNITYYNKTLIYGLLLQADVHTLLTIDADPKRLGARLAVTFVLHTKGSALAHRPYLHGIVLGGGLSLNGERWIQCRSVFLARAIAIIQALIFTQVSQLHARLQFFGEYSSLCEKEALENG